MTTKISSDNIQASTLATIGSGPKISQIQVCDSSYNTLDDTAVDIAGGYIKITGTGFKTGATVTINRQQAISVTFVNSTELRAQIAAETAGTYVVYVVNTDGSVALRVNGITFSALPSWTTASALPTGDSGTAISIQLVAAQATAYSVAQGSTLPPGITLSSGGLLSGTITITEETLYNFSVVATDAQLQDSPRSFSITITVGDIYFAATTLFLTGSANTFVSDASANNSVLTVSGDTRPSAYNPYLSNYSAQFTAKTSYVSVPANTSLTTYTGDFTFEAWIYPSDTTITYWGIWDSRQSGGVAQAMALNMEPLATPVTGRGRLKYFNGTSYYSTGTVFYNRWTHVAFVRSGTTLTFYVDGVASGTATVSGTQTGTATTNPIWIGSKDNGNASYGTTGFISNLRVVNGTAVYTSNFTPPAQPLTAIANTALLTFQNNRYSDASTNNYALTPSTAAISGFIPFVQTANANGSGYFDGTGDFLTTPTGNLVNFGTGDFTIEAWAYLTSLASFNGIFDSRTLGGTGTAITIFANGTVECGTGGAYVASAAGAFVANRWNHVAFTRTGTTARVFVNGVQVASATHTSNYSATYAFIGKTNDGWHCTGNISNVRVVKGTGLYTAAFTPPAAPLTAVSNTSLLTLQNSISHNNSQFVDASGSNLPVTRTGNATQGSFSPYSPSGWSNYFDGTGDFLTFTNTSGQGVNFGTSDFTVELWYYMTDSTTNSTYHTFIRQDTATNAFDFGYRPGAGNLSLGAGNVGEVTASVTLSANTWNHIAVSRSGTSLRFFVNGTQVGTTATNSYNFGVTGGTVRIGGNNFNAAYTVYGYVSNLRCTKSALYTANFTPPTQPLTAIAGTSLLTCCDNRFVDESPNNVAITRNGDVRVTNFSPFKAVAQTPQSYSTYFDGSGDYLTTPGSSNNDMGTGDFTIECFAISNGYSGSQYGRGLFALYPSGNYNKRIIVRHSSVGQILAIYGFDGTSTYFGSSGTGGTINLVVGQWYHIAFVRQSGVFRLYINGVQDIVVSNQTNITLADSNCFDVGRVQEGTTPDWNGYISNFRAIKGTCLYPNGTTFTPPTQPLTAITNTSLLTCQSATFTDNSANKFALTVSGNPTPTPVNPFGTTFVSSTGYTAAEYSGSMYFDGTGDYLDLPNNSIFSQVGAWTLELWVYPTVAQNNYVYSQVTTNFLQINISAAMSVLIDRSGVGTLITSTNPIPLSAWTHLALVSDGTNMRLFINGTQSGSTVAVGTQAVSATTTRIGAYQSNGTLGFAGYISDLRLVKGQAVYTANFVAPIAPIQPVHSTALTLSGTVAGITDLTTKNTIETLGDVRITQLVSKWGSSSMRFDGTGDYLALPASPNFTFGTGNFTVECWVNYVAATNSGIFQIGSSIFPLTNGVGLGLDASARWMLYYANGSAAGTAFGPAINTWYHVAVVRNSGTTRVYLDGIQVMSVADATNYTGTFLGIAGIYSTSYLMNGYLQDFRVTRGVARYTANFTPPASTFSIK